MFKTSKPGLIAALTIFLALPATVFGQARTPREQAKAYFNKGFAHYKAGQYLKAVKGLKTAYKIRPVPLVLFYIGKTYQAAELNEESITYFRKFLDEARLTDPNRKIALQAIRSMGGTVKAPPRVAIPVPRPRVRPRPRPRVAIRTRPKKRVKPGEIIHEAVEEARPRLPLMLEAELPDEIEWARLYLYFRSPGMDKFIKNVMKVGRRGIYTYLIHRSYLRGKSFQYYIEAVGRTGKRVAGSGRATSPNIILLSNDAPMQPGGRMDDRDQDPAGKGLPAGAVPIGTKGPTTTPKKPWVFYAAVGVSVATAALLATGVALSISARNSAQEMADRGSPKLPDGWVYPPDRTYTSKEESIQDQGKAFEIGAIVCYVLSAAAAGGATYLWLRHFGVVGKKEQEVAPNPPPKTQAVAPMIGKNIVGISYGLNF